MTYIKVCIFSLSLFVFNLAKSQVSNTGLMDTVGGVKIGQLSIGGYIDAYFGGGPNVNNSMPYFVSSAQINEFNINLAYIDLRYSDHSFRARFAPGMGTYMNANYQAEQGTLRNIVEASAGFRVFKNKEIWVDAGILGSPYTNESAVSKDHLMYTRSFAPEYVPYYLSGIKITTPLSSKMLFYTYILNGWQQIHDNNSGKALGTQLEYRPDNLNLINWNTYIGDESSSSAPDNRMRYFTDLYWVHNPDGVFSITSCVYAGNQKRKQGNELTNNYWWQANFIGRFSFNERLSLSGRVEYFSDANNVQISAINPNISGFSAFSGGLCLNVKIKKQALLRFDGRYFGAKDNLFIDKNNLPSKSALWLVSNMTVWF